MRKYTYILQTHNPDKKYVVDNIVENISCGHCRQYCEKKYIVNNVVPGPVWLVPPRCNTTKKLDDNSSDNDGLLFYLVYFLVHQVIE